MVLLAGCGVLQVVLLAGRGVLQVVLLAGRGGPTGGATSWTWGASGCVRYKHALLSDWSVFLLGSSVHWDPPPMSCDLHVAIDLYPLNS